MWLNSRINAHPKLAITVGSREVVAVAVTPDGRLEHEVAGGGTSSTALDLNLIDQIVTKALNL